jgi:hypothetical protein
MSDQNERQLDDLLNSALSAYSAVDPRPGLEARILAHIQDADAQPRAKWWNASWLVAGTVVAGIAVILLSILFLRPVQKPSHVQVQSTKPPAIQLQPESTRVTTKETPAPKERPPHHRPAEQVLAQSERPAIFPTPAPLSEQEKLMLVYVAQTPKEEIIAQMRPPNPEEEEEFWKDRQPAAARRQR